MINNVTVLILCGGRGSRMGKNTERVPKPLVEVNGKPMMFHIIEQLEKFNFNNIVLASGYLSHKVDEFVSHYYLEKTNLVTSNSGESASMLQRIYDARDYFRETILVCYGDTFIDLDFTKLVELSKKQLVTLVTGKIQNPFGIVNIDSSTNKIKSFTEKPIFDYYIGSFVFRKELLDQVSPDMLKMPDGKGLVHLFDLLLNKELLYSFPFEGLQVTFNTEPERVKAEGILENYLTLKEK